MSITAAMVEAALDAWYDDDGTWKGKKRSPPPGGKRALRR